MRRYFYETTSDLAPEQLYRAMTDIQNWPAWDDAIEGIEIDGPALAGTEFALKPRGRASIKIRIATMVEPYRFADIAYLPLAQMRTEHCFIPAPQGTLVRISLEITGLLAAFWDRPLAESHEAGAAAQTRRFLAFAARQQRIISNENIPQKPMAIPEKQPLPNYVFC